MSEFQNLIDAKEAAHIKHQPRDYQIEAITRVQETLEHNDRTQLLMACGTGKTDTALWVKEALLNINKPSTTIVLLPSLQLVRQFQAEWESNRSHGYQTQVVCSASDIKAGQTFDPEQDNIVLTETEIEKMKVTTDSDDVTKFLQLQGKSSPVHKVIFSTYHSAEVVASALRKTDQRADLVFCDEAHRTAGVDKSFGMVHDNNQLPANKRIYMTATPRIVAPSLRLKVEQEEQVPIYDMSDQSVYGPVAFELSFRKAIEMGILCDYEILAVTVIIDDVIKTLTESGKNFSPDYFQTDEGQTYLQALALNKVTQDPSYNGGRIISFHSRISKAEEFARIAPNLVRNQNNQSYQANSISGKNRTIERETRLSQLRDNNNQIASNSKVLIEGVNVPAVDSIYFADVRNSLVDIIQAAGRATRKSNATGKTKGYIIVPIIATAEELADASLGKSAKGIKSIENLINVVTALGQEDDLLRQELINFKRRSDQKQAEEEGKDLDDELDRNPTFQSRLRIMGSGSHLATIMQKIQLKVIRQARFESIWTARLDILEKELIGRKEPFSKKEQEEIFDSGNFSYNLNHALNAENHSFKDDTERQRANKLLTELEALKPILFKPGESIWTARLDSLEKELKGRKEPFSSKEQEEIFRSKVFLRTLKNALNAENHSFKDQSEKQRAVDLLKKYNDLKYK